MVRTDVPSHWLPDRLRRAPLIYVLSEFIEHYNRGRPPWTWSRR